MQPYAPLGTLYAASVLRSSGLEVALFDSMLAKSEDELCGAISRHRPRIIAVYDDSFNYLTKMCLERMRVAAFRMIETSKRAGCIVIVSGSDSTDHVAEYLARGADYVITGEGEYTLLELCSGIVREDVFDPQSVDGVSYCSKGEIVRSKPRKLMKGLDDLPFPAWDLVDIELYRKKWSRHGYFSMNVATTRGCPFGCNWCAKPVYGRVYNSRSPQNVVAELLMLKEKYGAEHIWFCDDIFGLKPGWIEEFNREMVRRQVGVRYKCLSRPDLLIREDTFDALAESGCETVWIGAESGEQKILDAMEKGTTVEQIKLATRKLKQVGIRVGYFLQFGYPGEDYAMIRKTIDLVREEMPDEIGISVSYPMPGTEFYDVVKESLGKKKNWFDSDDLDLLFPAEFQPRFYRILHRVIHRLHRLRRIRKGQDPLSMRSVLACIYYTLTLPLYLLGMKVMRTRNANRIAIRHGAINSP